MREGAGKRAEGCDLWYTRAVSCLGRLKNRERAVTLLQGVNVTMKVRTIALAAALILVASAYSVDTYTVKKGDTLVKVASKLGVAPDALAAKNHIGKHAMLQVGHKLKVPAKSQTTKAAKSSSNLPVAVSIKRDNVFVRKSATLKSKAIAKVAQGATAKVLGKAQGFYKVKFLGGTVGFVRWDMTSPMEKAPKINFISTSSVKVNKDGVNLRKSPSTNAGVVKSVSKGSVAAVLDRQGQWYKLRFAKGAVGYIRGDFLNPVGRSLRGGRSHTAIYASHGSWSQDDSAKNLPASSLQIVQNAKKMLGTPYVFASESSRGVDCSGLVCYLYKKTEGITPPRTSREQSTFGKKVDRNDLRPGDTIYFRGSRRGGVNHAAIYIGGGKYIHASSSHGRVIVSDVHSPYFARNFVVARRFDSKLSKTKSASSGRSSSGKKKSASK